MARAGILYSQVAQAAAQLAAAGTTPTVDTVRAALGNTGSKSTIAPMLKQWRAAHQGAVVAAGTGLPADLLEAVQGVYQRLEASAQAQVAQLRSAHDLAREEHAQLLDAERANGRQLRAERDVLAGELAQMKAAFVHERDERQHGAVTIAALQAEVEGLTQRLADRAAEARQLADQLAQARRQFDHYQAKAAEQLRTERQNCEERIAAADRAGQQLRASLQEQEQAVAVLSAEKRNLQDQVDRAAGEVREHVGEIYTLRVLMASWRETASRKHTEAKTGAEMLATERKENVALLTRTAALEAEVAALRERLAVAGPVKAPATAKKR